MFDNKEYDRKNIDFFSIDARKAEAQNLPYFLVTVVYFVAFFGRLFVFVFHVW